MPHEKEFHLLGQVRRVSGALVVDTACGLRVARFAPCHKEESEVIAGDDPKYVTCGNCKKTISGE